MHWLIDDRGECWPAASETLRQRIGFAQTSLDVRCDYLVRNAGYILVRLQRQGVLLRWRPALTQRATVAALVLLLRELGEQRVLVSTLRAGWYDRLAASVGQAIEIVGSELATETSDVEGHFRSRRRRPEEIAPNSPLRGAVLAAMDAGRAFDPFALWQLLERTVAGRYILLEPVATEKKLKIVTQGNGYRTLSKEWRRQAPGAIFDSQPDRSYARAAASGFWAALEADEPVIEAVDASIWWPGRGRTFLCYDRLILPLKVERKQLLLSASQLIEPTALNR